MLKFKNQVILFSFYLLKSLGRGTSLMKKTLNSEQILKLNYLEKSVFTFVQIGANDGISFDFLYDFVTKRNAKGIVVEPIKDYFKELQINYEDFQNIIPLNIAIHPTNSTVILYRLKENSLPKYKDWAKGIASLDKNHLIKLNIEEVDIEGEEVKADALMTIIQSYHPSGKLDYIQIDTEGFDYQILKMIDFTVIKPKIVKYESINLTENDRNKAVSLLKKNGYYLFKEAGDTVAILLNKVRLN